jgi:threonine/homoserine/homoserine lactone efflux protein
MGGLLFYGVKKWRHARTQKDQNIAYVAFGLAALCALFNAPLLFMLLIGAALLYFGWKLIEAKPSHSIAYRSTSSTKNTFDNSFDADWKEFVDKNKTN